MDYDWLHLPEHLWITIFQKLDVKTLLMLSETCLTFNYLLFNTILSKKFKLFINLRIDEQLVNIFKYSNRKYRIVKCFNDSENSAKPSAGLEIMVEILNRFFDSIREIEIRGIRLSSSNWNRLIKSLKYVETFDLSNVNVDMTQTELTGIEKSALKIDSLSMFFLGLGYMDIFDGASVKKVKLFGQSIIQYEPFLMNHEELKSLSADIPQLFEGDKLSNVKFSLEHLHLYFDKWTKKQYALNFIRTQTELQSVFLCLDDHQYDILFLKHIINNNPNLKILYIDLDLIADGTDLYQIDTNLSVTHFYFHCYPENIELTDKMYRLFPNNLL